ncbi:hypothetical protein A0O34_20735 [Chryseobacterium glaciei]|uniref:Uncharacterized protein n=1 Tax=Chryseobacterium glaciei TaxID=1685010 RepID=A0A172Y0R1_9FLAO|nr:hypothetical protein [Chryseobacterium glaciei]ANF52791.1 hypothetical protein A0O34_20735 [Chryseobacterium glaciei]
MKKENFSHLLGKSRNEIIKELGDGFNYFNNEIWTYEVGKTWFGRKIILSLTFKEEKVSELNLIKRFGRC